MTEIKNKILNALNKGQISMIPRWKFVLYTSLTIVSFVVLLLAVIFIVSLIFFLLSVYGFLSLPMFGLMKTTQTLLAIPPVLFVTSLLLLIIVELISRKISFGFKRPLVVSLALFSLFALFVGFVVSLTPLHKNMQMYAHKRHMALLSRAYERPRLPRPQDGVEVFRGEVISKEGESITISLFDGSNVTAQFASTSLVGTSSALIGEEVVVIGKMSSSTFTIIDMKDGSRLPFNKGRKLPREMMRPEMMK